MKPLCLSLLLLALLLVPGVLLSQQTPRPAALLLSNWKYRHLAPLLTPEADLTAMQRVLESLDPPYEVTVVANRTSAEMRAAVEAFAKRHAGNPVVLVYTSGHGLQVAGGNYLTGVDVDMAPFEEKSRNLRRIYPNDDDYRTQVEALQRVFARDHLVSVDTMIGALGAMSPPEAGDEHVKMVFIDACREPFPEVEGEALAATKSVFGGKSAGGLARVTERPGIFVGMSAAANQVAQQNDRDLLKIRQSHAPELNSKGAAPFLWEHFGKGGSAADLVDGELPPSFFTERLVAEIAKGGSLEAVFKRAGAAVQRDSKKLVQESRMRVVQTPAHYSLYYGSYRFGYDYTGYDYSSGNTLSDRLRAAKRERPFVNSLGLEFVPVPGKEGVWLCRTETRVRDFRAYAAATDYVQKGGAYVLKVKETPEGGHTTAWELDEKASWEKPGFEQSEDHAVVCVSWEEARAMAEWLSKQEKGLTYRLPTDAEWSAAVGGVGKYPWGNAWPPPKGAGNYAGSEWAKHMPGSGWPTVYAHDDGAERTARVGSYVENRFGFFDLGGNAWEWCEDFYKASMNDADALEEIPALKTEKYTDGIPFRVLRGGSWYTDREVYLRSSYRSHVHPARRSGLSGFRLVVSVGAGG